MKSFLPVIFLLTIMLLSMSSCAERNLRGWWEPSNDGKTYLVVDDDNGGKCGPLLLDGKVWPHKIGERGVIEPGVHELACPLKVGFRVEAGVEYHFDYWGP